MKCPRCQAEMQRRKLKEHQFQYRCPKCGLVIGAKDSDRYQEAYETQMSSAEN